ncbi:MAG: AAA family ATPase [Candidatus Accumulibacter sp.]|nr:AAA family ATPase [Accumulibacter sp.]
MEEGMACFLFRPRRFGKSLFLDTQERARPLRGPLRQRVLCFLRRPGAGHRSGRREQSEQAGHGDPIQWAD